MKAIFAVDKNGGIGYKNKLPWNNIQGDLPRFKQLTSNKVILMGRNTWESLPVKPLPNRINVVVSSKPIDGITTITDLPDKDYMDLHDAWLIGGANLFKQSWHLIDEIHLTRLDTVYQCDTFINLNEIEKQFKCTSSTQYTDHHYQIWIRK